MRSIYRSLTRLRDRLERALIWCLSLGGGEPMGEKRQRRF